MTTGDAKAREEYERLLREVQLANMRETHRLLTSTWRQKVPGIATAAMAFLAGAGVALLLVVVARHVAL
ncbi:hypothetical protein [Frateuria defendens]|uniref:hypothetical protein n=1 Tax=Frateuria defendens TaxID=2219559 RepID=UPI00066FE962|nr:hypothetical protein [Frateuria defendens]